MSLTKIFLRQFHNLLIYVLLAASIISILIGEITDFFVINFMIFINGLIGFWQEVKAETSIAALKKLTESRNKVLRDGILSSISSSELVPGDLVIFHEGEIITADLRLIESSGLMTDEASLTGESVPVAKEADIILPQKSLPYEWKNLLLAGTSIVRGTGKGVVVATGKSTYFASIADKSTQPSPDTPLTKALAFFTKRYIFLLVSLFICLGLIGYYQERSLVELAYILLASLVSAVPEGLPIVITLVMVIGALALSRKQALIRYLPSVETLGSASVIASDKTGTITEGKLVVKEVFSPSLEKLKQIAALCNDAHKGSGDPLDVALSDWIENYDHLRSIFPRKWAYAFDAHLMLMATVNNIHGKEELLVKGAFESLKEKAKNAPLFEKAFHLFLQQGLRVLAFGAGKWEHEDPAKWHIELIGLIGFVDPPKAGVKEAVLSAKKAGIHVVMMTGDHPMTAKTIAKEVGIWKEDEKILTGKEIETLEDSSLLHKLTSTTVLARFLPEHKYRLVKLLQSQKEIVAMTGDGINDIPALKAADIGIAMGNGAEAAKNVAKMVITDNNLKVIVSAIENARIIADNIRKVIYYLLATSLQEICLIALAIFFAVPIPLSAIQILWINIVTDGVQDKTFAFIAAERDVMQRKPRKPDKQFFDFLQIVRVLSFGGVMGLFCFSLYLYLLALYPFLTASTILFTCIVIAQWANGIQAQKEQEPFFQNIKKSFTLNPWIFLGLSIGILLQCSAIYLTPNLFHSTPLDLEHWRYPILTFVVAFLLVEARKWIEKLFRLRDNYSIWTSKR